MSPEPLAAAHPALSALRAHWPEYALEAIELGLFMISACLFTMLLEHPGSPVRQAIDAPLLRRLLMGVAMGSTAIAIIYSPLGQRSGAHMNPAVTLAFLRLGRVARWDAAFYVTAQFLGGIAGVALMSALIGPPLGADTVRYVATLPRGMSAGDLGLAWLAEFVIALLLMLIILTAGNRRSLARWTGVLAGCLVATYITVEAPLSGMSMNPARTFGSALSANLWTGLWIYFSAPPLAMLLACEVHRRLPGLGRVYCAKLNHFTRHRCIFRCQFDRLMDGRAPEG